MTYIRFFFVLYWFALFLKFGPLPSQNPRCAPVEEVNILKKINTKLDPLWRQSNYHNYSSRTLLFHALIQPRFDYGCTSWYLLLSRALKNQLQIAQNKCILFCLELQLHEGISVRSIPVTLRCFSWRQRTINYELCTSTTVLHNGE